MTANPNTLVVPKDSRTLVVRSINIPVTPTLVKDPDAVLDYIVDWSRWLFDDDTISSVTWIVPEGLTQPNDPENTSTDATVWLGGGTSGRHPITCEIVTTGGRTNAYTFYLKVVRG